MATKKLLLLPGDGIGPEAMAEVRKLIAAMNREMAAGFETEEGLVGGSAYDAHGKAISEADMGRALAADAVLFGAVGGPKWDRVGYDFRPEAGLLRLRKDLELFANLRPTICYPALAGSSSLKREVVEGLDILIVRELTGGVYFGEPKEILRSRQRPEAGRRHAGLRHLRDRADRRRRLRARQDAPQSGLLDGEEQRHEVRPCSGGRSFRRSTARATPMSSQSPAGRRRRHAAGALAQAVRRHRHRQSVRRHAVRRRGDAHGSLGMLPSASLGSPDPLTGKRKALYEPVHGSAPDIAGQGIANPIAMIASFAMCLRYSFAMAAEADRLEAAIAAVLDDGLRTGDIAPAGAASVGTEAMGDAIIAKFLG